MHVPTFHQSSPLSCTLVYKAQALPWLLHTLANTGNLKTLGTDPKAKGLNVREAVVDFHRRHYSANIMKVVVMGRQSLDEVRHVLQSICTDNQTGISRLMKQCQGNFCEVITAFELEVLTEQDACFQGMAEVAHLAARAYAKAMLQQPRRNLRLAFAGEHIIGACWLRFASNTVLKMAQRTKSPILKNLDGHYVGGATDNKNHTHLPFQCSS